MEFGILASGQSIASFIYDLAGIIIINLILAGDNAVVIAMAVRSIPLGQRRQGLVYGAGAAVLLRVALTFFVSRLLEIEFIKLCGGILIIWIAVKLFIEGSPDKGPEMQTTTLRQAIKILLIADITMSLDNMLAVAAAAHGSLFLLVFGLGLSIPFVIFTSGLLATLMDKYPIIVAIGAAILGRVGGEMMITDPIIMNYFSPGLTVQYAVQGVFTIGVVIAGKLWVRRLAASEAASEQEPDRKD